MSPCATASTDSPDVIFPNMIKEVQNAIQHVHRQFKRRLIASVQIPSASRQLFRRTSLIRRMNFHQTRFNAGLKTVLIASDDACRLLRAFHRTRVNRAYGFVSQPVASGMSLFCTPAPLK